MNTPAIQQPVLSNPFALNVTILPTTRMLNIVTPSLCTQMTKIKQADARTHSRLRNHSMRPLNLISMPMESPKLTLGGTSSIFQSVTLTANHINFFSRREAPNLDNQLVAESGPVVSDGPLLLILKSKLFLFHMHPSKNLNSQPITQRAGLILFACTPHKLVLAWLTTSVV